MSPRSVASAHGFVENEASSPACCRFLIDPRIGSVNDLTGGKDASPRLTEPRGWPGGRPGRPMFRRRPNWFKSTEGQGKALSERSVEEIS